LFQRPAYFAGRSIIRLYAFLMFRLDILRQAKLPGGPKILVANHPSGTDPFIIHLMMKERLNVLITESAFNVPVFGSFLRTIGEIPVPLENGSCALEQAHQYIREGRSVAIFIEGTFSPPQGGFLPPRTGAARLALMSGAPIVPVGIYLRREIALRIRSKISGKPTEGTWYLRGPYAMTVGEPMRFEGDVEDREYVRHLSDQIMREIKFLARESERRTRRLKLAPSLT
jgi:1-acyl-sn-glycerol-3-phosphate acyltransferase